VMRDAMQNALPDAVRRAHANAMPNAKHVRTYGRTYVRSGYVTRSSSAFVTRARAYPDLAGFDGPAVLAPLAGSAA